MRDVNAVFAAGLKALRRERGLSQEALAEKAHVSAAGISSIERGACGPSRFVADALAKALGTTLGAMLGDGSQGAVKGSAPSGGPLMGADAMRAVRAAQADLKAAQRNARGKRTARAVGAGMGRVYPGGAR